MASIFVMSGRNEGDYYPLGHRTSVIGRAESNPIQILDDLVSRKHMQIHFDKEADRYCALDMKSTHGVFINGRRIHEETALADGDHIRIGHTDMLFTLEDFADRESAMSHYKKVGERIRTTLISD
jgi:pSer/pThr/pTyr-binding forkhead associated (FHA) protein